MLKKFPKVDIGARMNDVGAAKHCDLYCNIRADAHENTGSAPPQGFRLCTGALQGFPCVFQQQALLRVVRGGFYLGYAKEGCVEPLQFIEFEKRAPFGIAFSRYFASCSAVKT